MAKEIFPIDTTPKKMADIILISGNVKRRGYYDPYGSVAGGKYFYYRKDRIQDCAYLKRFPTHWHYVK